MTEQMWHLKMCQLCPWTISEKKQTNLTQTLPSSWLQSLVIIFLEIFVCDFSLSVFVRPQLWEFSHLQCQWWESKSRTAVLHHILCHRDPDPNHNWGFYCESGKTTHVQDTALAYDHKSLKQAHSPSCDQSTGHDCASYFCLVNTCSFNFYFKYLWGDAAPICTVHDLNELCNFLLKSIKSYCNTISV